jgi:polyhydroxyalkanoate synthesis regulator phasin
MMVKKSLVDRGAKLLLDPRILKFIQDERVIKAAMAAMSMPGKAQAFAKERLEGAAKALALATEAEVKDLRRTVRRLEEEVASLRGERSGSISARDPLP